MILAIIAVKMQAGADLRCDGEKKKTFTRSAYAVRAPANTHSIQKTEETGPQIPCDRSKYTGYFTVGLL